MHGRLVRKTCTATRYHSSLWNRDTCLRSTNCVGSAFRRMERRHRSRRRKFATTARSRHSPTATIVVRLCNHQRRIDIIRMVRNVQERKISRVKCADQNSPHRQFGYVRRKRAIKTAWGCLRFVFSAKTIPARHEEVSM